MIRLRGRKKYMACAYCNVEKGWPEHFVNQTYAECLTCWLGHHLDQVEPMREALAEHDLRQERARV